MGLGLGLRFGFGFGLGLGLELRLRLGLGLLVHLSVPWRVHAGLSSSCARATAARTRTCAPAACTGGRGGRSPGPGAAPRGRGGEKDGPCAASGSAMPGGFPGNVVFMICDDVMCVLVMLCACSRISWWRGVHACNASKISLWCCVHDVLVTLCAGFPDDVMCMHRVSR